MIIPQNFYMFALTPLHINLDVTKSASDSTPIRVPILRNNIQIVWAYVQTVHNKSISTTFTRTYKNNLDLVYVH